MSELMTNKGESVADLSRQGSVMLVFLRHFGCTFCRESLVELSKLKREFDESAVKLVFVHMSEESYAREVLRIYELDDVSHISDPGQNMYRQYGLQRGKWWQLVGLRVALRGFAAGLLKGHLPGKVVADPYQMPGVFMLKKNKVVSQFVHRYASDRPHYRELLNC